MAFQNQPFTRHLARVLAVTLAACALIGAGATRAHATEPTVGEPGPSVDRVIDRSHEKMPWRAAARSTAAQEGIVVGVASPVPADLAPGEGETVQVNYADGVVLHQSIAAGCTVSKSAGVPEKRSGKAQARHTLEVSVGCTNRYSATGYLIEGSATRDSDTWSGGPGSYASWLTSRTCSGSGGRAWYAMTDDVTSAKITLACNT